MRSQGNQRRGVLLGMLGLVAVIAILVIYFVSTSSPSSSPLPPKVVAPGTPVYAPQGQITPQFPKELILDPQAQISSSFAIDYSTSTHEYTAQWNSQSSMGDLYNKYLQYFSGNGWTITNKITKYPTSRGIYADNTSSSASAAIIQQGSSTQVIVGYVTK